jgi:hypothetical protein
LKIEGYEVRVMAVEASLPSRLPRNEALLLPPGGRVDAFINIGAPSAPTPILLHNGREARSIGRVVVANQSPLRQTSPAPAPPLPSNGLPAQIDLKSALRLDLTLGAVQTGWIRPEKFVASAAPAFRAKAGHPFGLADCPCGGRASRSVVDAEFVVEVPKHGR